jgi:FMN-dependent NADH-azoreductase
MDTFKRRFNLIIGIFDNVGDSFSGSYSENNAEISIMRSELETEKIPSISDDRENLKKDSSNVVSDYNKAFRAKKAELSL